MNLGLSQEPRHALAFSRHGTLPGKPGLVPCLHDGLIFGILESLQSRLPEPYYAQYSQRVWLEVSHRSVEPDVNVIPSGRRPSRRQGDNGGVAVADLAELAEPSPRSSVMADGSDQGNRPRPSSKP